MVFGIADTIEDLFENHAEVGLNTILQGVLHIAPPRILQQAVVL
jgi:hypothetical protein